MAYPPSLSPPPRRTSHPYKPVPDLSWNASFASAAANRLQGMLFSVCSSPRLPKMPPYGLLNAVAERRFRVNVVVRKGYIAPGPLVSTALSTWMGGRVDFQVWAAMHGGA